MRFRTIILALTTLLLAVSCASGDLEDVREEIEGKNGGGANVDVKPPAQANSRLTARVGLIVATNSETWKQLIDAPVDKGVAVLFAQPDGPAEEAGVKRGDVITKVDGQPATNADRAVVLLRARPNERTNVDVVSSTGRRSVSIVAKVPPANLTIRNFYEPLIAKSPNDPIAYFLRAQAGGTFDEALRDVDKAIELRPDFVEAISLRGEMKWNRAGNPGIDATAVEQLRDNALSDWELALKLDPDNTRVLVSRSQALAARGNAARARRDAQRAIDLDETFPRAYYALGIANVWLGRYEDAAPPARKAIDLDPFDVRYYRALAAIFMRLDQKDNARKTIDAILPLVEDQATKDSLRQVLEEGGAP